MPWKLIVGEMGYLNYRKKIKEEAFRFNSVIFLFIFSKFTMLFLISSFTINLFGYICHAYFYFHTLKYICYLNIFIDMSRKWKSCLLMDTSVITCFWLVNWASDCPGACGLVVFCLMWFPSEADRKATGGKPTAKVLVRE